MAPAGSVHGRDPRSCGRCKDAAGRRPFPLLCQVLRQNGIHFLDLVQFFMNPACEVFARVQELEGRLTVAATLAFEG